MFKVRKEAEIQPVFLRAGDTLSVSFTDKDGVTHQLINEQIDVNFVFNQAKILEFRNEFGLKEGFACVIGS